MDQKALHAEIFGEDSDEDEDYVAPAADAEGDDDGGDDRVDQILEGNNNLLLSKKEKKKKDSKAKEGSGSRGKRKAKDADDGDGGALKKRLKKRRAAAEAGEGLVEGGEGGAGPSGAAEDDPDEDSGSGSEAVEEGGKKDFDSILKGLKAKRGGPSFSREKMVGDVKVVQERMEEAVEDDDKAAGSDPPRPALSKVAMLPEVEAILRKKHYHEVMIDHGMLSTIARWLRPMPDGSLVSAPVRKTLLQALTRFDIDETVLGSLRSSGLGKYVKLLTLHKKEIPENRKVALSLVEKWSRPIFQTSDKVHATDLPVADRHGALRNHAELEQASVFNTTSGPQIGSHARVPRPMGMDFAMLPQSLAAPLPSSKYTKDSVKGRLTDRILTGKKRSSTQAATLSVEGRTLDRI